MLTLSLVVRKVSQIAIPPNVRRLLIKVLEVFEAFQKQHMGSFYALTCKTDCLQIVYEFCKNWISVPNIVHQLTLSLRCKYCKIHSRSNFQKAINSIRRSANGRSEANDVSLLWRHSCWSCSWRLERAYKRPFLTVLGKFEPQNFVGHRVDPKRHFVTSQRVFWAIVRDIPCTGYFSRRVR